MIPLSRSDSHSAHFRLSLSCTRIQMPCSGHTSDTQPIQIVLSFRTSLMGFTQSTAVWKHHVVSPYVQGEPVEAGGQLVIVQIVAQARTSAKTIYAYRHGPGQRLGSMTTTAGDQYYICNAIRANGVCAVPKVATFPSTGDKHYRLLHSNSQRPIWCFLGDLDQILRRKHCANDEITIC